MTTPGLGTGPTNPLTPDDVVSQMRAALAISEPDLDTSIGSITRKILDAVGAAIAPAYSDQYLLDYAWNIDSKTGTDLDDFVGMFGFTRFPAARATGVVTFGRTTATTTDVTIPAAVQVATTDGTVVVATVVASTLVTGSTSVDIPVQATVGGSAGNVAALTLTQPSTTLSGITSVFNTGPMSGGTDVETDAALIARFKSTVLRSMAGTESMYLGIALDPTSIASSNTDAVVTSANVIGSSRRWREQVQIEGGAATSSIPVANVKYVYAGTDIFGSDIDDGDILTEGIHYSFTNTLVPSVASLNSALTNGGLYDLDFEYVPSASRNDAANGITNRVDVWVDGVDATTATQIAYLTVATVFNNTTGSPLKASNFVRLNSAGVAPSVGNIFMQLGFGPILTFPQSLTIAGTTYIEGTDYWVVHDDTAFGYSPTSLYGIEWRAAHHPADGTQISLADDTSYTYNYVPWALGAAIQDWRALTTDVQVHQARSVYLLINLAVMITPHVDQPSVITAISTAIQSWFAANGFDAALQASDLLAVVHSVSGVDNVRFTLSTEDTTHYAWQQVSSDGTTIMQTFQQGGRAEDIILGDSQIPVLFGVNVTVRAQNTWKTS